MRAAGTASVHAPPTSLPGSPGAPASCRLVFWHLTPGRVQAGSLYVYGEASMGQLGLGEGEEAEKPFPTLTEPEMFDSPVRTTRRPPNARRARLAPEQTIPLHRCSCCCRCSAAAVTRSRGAWAQSAGTSSRRTQGA